MNRKVNITVIGYPKILSQCRDIAEEYLDTANFLYYHYRANSGSVKYMDASPDHPFTDCAEIFTDISHDIIVVGIVTAKMMTTVIKIKSSRSEPVPRPSSRPFQKPGKLPIVPLSSHRWRKNTPPGSTRS